MKFSSLFSLFALTVSGMGAITSAADEVVAGNNLRGGRSLEDDGNNGFKW